jgi:predicted ribosome quality control (RQC) complex YloA/Tae2 family protein
MPCFSKPVPYVRSDWSRVELGDVKNYSNQLYSEYIKQSKAIMDRLDRFESRLNDRLDNLDARLDRTERRLDDLEIKAAESK